MTNGDRIGPALLRVRVGGEVVGAGFLVTPSLAVTCAHVAASDATAPHPPADAVVVEFPLLGADVVPARIVAWQPLCRDGAAFPAGGMPERVGDVEGGRIYPRPGRPGEVVMETAAGLVLWDLAARRDVGVLEIPIHLRRGMFAFDETGRRVAFVEEGEQGVQVWDVERRVQLVWFPVRVAEVLGFVGDVLVVEVISGVQFWRGARLEAEISLPDRMIGSLRVRGDALRYLSRVDSGDQVAVTPWRMAIDPWRVFEELCRMADREFTEEERTRMLPPEVPASWPCAR
ncbi:hypothetical protein ABZ816_32230 [Actinosynnema sp. NPDC047251]|uniref:Trypsin-like peptidase domain-containing protein n=1 Tax=Saccharothrix espanaensis (strain ATCC 51144 / DSM 44229 / JCM 9112 / NBRC 15066 / NRRL 15764) TaxID=1179773 RepID=K0JZ42_SACES|nr:hypothetical protein [Saccharothrix espanaensis]CCH29949.1 hypothetical protein BN6_26360 [Saccharothrix espanaensis DSM 44229]